MQNSLRTVRAASFGSTVRHALSPVLMRPAVWLRRLVHGGIARSSRRPTEADLSRIAGRLDGRTRFAALHLESMRSIGIDAESPTPMASTVKIALAVEVMSRAAAGDVDLGMMVDVEPRHLRPGHGLITSRLGAPGVSLSVSQLLRLAMVDSDNTATDILFDLVGGPPAVERRVRTLGIDGMRIDRTILQVMSDRRGLSAVAPDREFDVEDWKARARGVSADALAQAGHAFRADHRDSTTANAMVHLLSAIQSGRALPPGHAETLLGFMRSCMTGDGRLRAGLPPGASIAHKTGTFVGLVSADAGIVTLPGGDHIVLAIFVTGSTASAREQDRLISDLARTACRVLEPDDAGPLAG